MPVLNLKRPFTLRMPPERDADGKITKDGGEVDLVVGINNVTDEVANHPLIKRGNLLATKQVAETAITARSAADRVAEAEAELAAAKAEAALAQNQAVAAEVKARAEAEAESERAGQTQGPGQIKSGPLEQKVEQKAPPGSADKK